MFGIGLWELLIVVAVSIVFIRPKDLPVVFQNLGRLYRRIRSFQRTFAEMARDIESEIHQSASTVKPDSEKDNGKDRSGKNQIVMMKEQDIAGEEE